MCKLHEMGFHATWSSFWAPTEGYSFLTFWAGENIGICGGSAVKQILV